MTGVGVGLCTAGWKGGWGGSLGELPSWHWQDSRDIRSPDEPISNAGRVGDRSMRERQRKVIMKRKEWA